MKEYELNGEIFRETIVQNYYVTRFGSVAKILFNENEICYFIRLKGDKTAFGHIRVELNRKKYSVHRLVFECWAEEDLDKNLVIDHIDANPANNNISNLRQVSQKENIQNAIQHGNFGMSNCRKLKVFDAVTNQEKNYNSIKEFLIDIGAPDYIIKHNSLSGLKKRKEYSRYHVTKINEY